MHVRVLMLAALLTGSVVVPALALAQSTPTPVTSAPVLGYRVLAAYPHDPQAYTQGLDYVDGALYEGTGLNGQSSLRRVDLETGEVLQGVVLNQQLFGEGITVVEDRIYQLTWKNELAIQFDRETFEPLETFRNPTEGWGLTFDGERLIASDGSNRLYFRDPETFVELDSVEVYDGEAPVTNLNELEYIDGEVWANIWRSDLVARIDPATGLVTSWVDLSGLLSRRDRREHDVDVLNGITDDPATGRIFVTGKLWPKLFAIEVVADE